MPFLLRSETGEKVPVEIIDPPAPVALQPTEEIKLQIQADEIIATGDITKCDEVQNDMYRAVCINNIALNQALDSGDVKLCEKMDGEMVPKMYCEQQILFNMSSVSKIGLDCSLFNETLVRQQCLFNSAYNMALEEENPLICDQISNNGNYSADQCHDLVKIQILLTKGNSDVVQKVISCEGFRDISMVLDCRELIQPALSSSDGDVRQVLSTFCPNFKSTVMFGLFCSSYSDYD